MHSSTLLFTSLVLGFAAAQNSTATSSSSFVVPTNEVGMLNTWCTGQQNTCGQLCGGNQYIQPNGNKCDPNTLKFTCICQNGKIPDNLDQYQNTVPWHECTYTFQQCQTQTAGSESCNSKCGDLNAQDIKAGAGAKSTSMAAASSTAASSASGTSASAAATQTKGAATRFGPEAGLAAAAVGIMGALL